MFPYRRLPGHITGLYVFAVANFLLLCHMTLVQGDITVLSVRTNQTVYDNIPDMPAYFGEPIPDVGILGQVVYANPPNACSAIDGPPNSTSNGLIALKWFVLIKRNDCSFSQKVLNAQKAGYDAAIVHNVNSDQLEPMGPSQGKVIDIPSVFIGETNGLVIKRLYTYDKGCFVYIDNEIPDIFWPFSLDRYLLPFAVLLAMCFMATIATLVFKCIRDRRHRMRHRLPTRLLKKLPIQKFKSGDQYDVCAICLEDYKEGEKLRVLPCSHTYHTKCIDPWLTENRRNCPVCKRKVFLGVDRTPRHRPSDTDSEEDDDDDDGSIAPNESTPLINPASVVTGSGHAIRGRSSEPSAPDAIGEEQRGDDENNGDADRYGRLATMSMSSTTSSQGGGYQAFVTPSGSPVAEAAASLMLALPVVLVGRDLTSSSGEHSVNGEYVDFSPIRQQQQAVSGGGEGPVEIAIDVAARQQWQQEQREKASSGKNSHFMVV